MAHIVPANDASIAEACARLRAGGVVAMPTETVYGLAADTFCPAALTRVYELKGRPSENPLIAHVLDGSMARTRLAAIWDDRCERLATRFWPGPLTLVLPKKPGVLREATAGLATIALRSPRHPVARRLLEAFDSPLSAPSANISGHVSPTTAAHVAADFAHAHDLIILDGGPCEIGIESTVLDLSSAPPRILRPGAVTTPMLREILGDVLEPSITRQDASPGTAPRHYAPRTPAVLWKNRDVFDAPIDPDAHVAGLLLENTFSDDRRLAKLFAHARSRIIVMPADAESYAARLYDALRDADSIGAALIVIEKPPRTDGLWASIHDRLLRATSR